MALSLVLSLRPSQWTKNLIVFLPLMFAQRLLDVQAGALLDRRLRDLLWPLGRRLPDQRRRGSGGGPAAPDQATPADCLRGAHGAGSRRLGGAHRRPVARGCLLAETALRRRRHVVRRAAGALLGPAEARRDSRRADDRDRVRAARRGRRGGTRRADQPLALRPHDPAGAVSGAQQAAARTGAPRRRRDEPSPDSRGVQPVSAGSDDRRRVGVDHRGLCVLHREP